MKILAATVVLLGLLLIPALSAAQEASITGVVRDTSGAVLPGVTVEATSPVLIEKVRSVVTDGTGQYRIIDLLPGTYVVTFALPGFATIRREGIELTGSFVATVNIDLRVGTLEETVTVSGETPIVDVQSMRQQQTMSNELISALPTGRSHGGLATLIPGMVTSNFGQDVGGITGLQAAQLVIHGSGRSAGRLKVDGFGVGSPSGDFGAHPSYYVADVVNAEEVVISTSGNLGEAESGGAVFNVIPRQGGNTMRGSFFFNFANGGMQGSNYTQALKDQGLRAPNKLDKLWEVNAGVGGPIVKDRLWYFVTGRNTGTRVFVDDVFINKNAGNANAWTYEPDLTKQAINDGTWNVGTLRLTWQVSVRNKVNVHWDEQSRCVLCIAGSGNATNTPEAAADSFAHPDGIRQATWSSPVTSRLLLEAGLTSVPLRWGSKGGPGQVRDLVRVTEQGGVIPGLNYRGGIGRDSWNHTWAGRAAVSYITGAHSMKFGFTASRLVTEDMWFNTGLTYRFNNTVPNLITTWGDPYNTIVNRTPLALYAQDQSTFGRLTLQGGLRYDHSRTGFPDQQVGPSRFIPTPLFYPAQDGVDYKDISPRVGAAYDLFGNGRTALKANLGKYPEVQDAGGPGTDLNPLNRLAGAAAIISSTNTSRSWNDTNRNYVPDCDLLNPAANGECGAWANQNFGKNVTNTAFNPAITSGWGVVPYDWYSGVSVQQQIGPRMSASVGYYRTWFGNFIVTDNLAVGPSDYSRFSITAPVDARLPGGGGFTIGDLYDVNPEKFGQVSNYATSAASFGDQIVYWHGVDVNVDARPRPNLTVRGGLSSGRKVTDTCDVTPKMDNPSQLYCHVAEAMQTQIKALGSYTVPRWDVQVSGTFQSIPGPSLAANYVVPNALVAPSLGRSLSGGVANVTVNLIAPGTMYGARLNQLDIRVAKLFRMGRTRTLVGVDLYNALNSDFIATYNLTYGPRWLSPTAVLPARFAKFTMQVDF